MWFLSPRRTPSWDWPLPSTWRSRSFLPDASRTAEFVSSPRPPSFSSLFSTVTTFGSRRGCRTCSSSRRWPDWGRWSWLEWCISCRGTSPIFTTLGRTRRLIPASSRSRSTREYSHMRAGIISTLWRRWEWHAYQCFGWKKKRQESGFFDPQLRPTIRVRTAPGAYVPSSFLHHAFLFLCARNIVNP